MSAPSLRDAYGQPLAVLADLWLAAGELLPMMPRIIGHRGPAASAPRRESTSAPGVAVVDVFGILGQRRSMLTDFFGTALEDLSRLFQALLASPNILAIVFNVDSPGGPVAGVPEFASMIYDARGQKKIVAIANSLAASAAYWIGSAASSPAGSATSARRVTSAG